MISAWTKHLKEEDKDNFKKQVLSSKAVLGRLGVLLQELEGDLIQTELDTRIYDIPNWDYRQAHTNGFRDCLRKINKLINLDQKETK